MSSFFCFCQTHSFRDDSHVEVSSPPRKEPPWPPNVPGAKSLNTTNTTTTIPDMKMKTNPPTKSNTSTIKTAQHQPAARTRAAHHQLQTRQPPVITATSDTITPHNLPHKTSADTSPPHLLPLKPVNGGVNGTTTSSSGNKMKEYNPPPAPPAAASSILNGTHSSEAVVKSTTTTTTTTKLTHALQQQQPQQQETAARHSNNNRASTNRSSSSSSSLNQVDSERLEKEIQAALNFLKINLQLNGPAIPPPSAGNDSSYPVSTPSPTINGTNGTTTTTTKIQLSEALRSIRNALKLRLQLLHTTLSDIIQVMTKYLDYYDDTIRIEAISVVIQVVLCFGDATLPYLDDQHQLGSSSNDSSSSSITIKQQQKSTSIDARNSINSSGGKCITASQVQTPCLIKELLKIATRHQENKLVQRHCNKLLELMAERLHQENMIKILSKYSEDWSVPRMRAKAASLLVIVTYRIR